MSVEKTTNSDGAITEINSAAFTATVNLKATFGDAPTLGGTVTDFRGAATDAKWSVELLTSGEFATLGAVTAGTTVASGQNGVWTAQAYGPDERKVARRASSAASTPTSRTVMPPVRTPRGSSCCITWDRDLAVRS